MGGALIESDSVLRRDRNMERQPIRTQGEASRGTSPTTSLSNTQPPALKPSLAVVSSLVCVPSSQWAQHTVRRAHSLAISMSLCFATILWLFHNVWFLGGR